MGRRYARRMTGRSFLPSGGAIDELDVHDFVEWFEATGALLPEGMSSEDFVRRLLAAAPMQALLRNAERHGWVAGSSLGDDPADLEM